MNKLLNVCVCVCDLMGNFNLKNSSAYVHLNICLLIMWSQVGILLVLKEVQILPVTSGGSESFCGRSF